MIEFGALGLEKGAEDIAQEKQNAGGKKIEQNLSKAEGKAARQPPKIAREKRVDSSGIEMLCQRWKSKSEPVDHIADCGAQQDRSQF